MDQLSKRCPKCDSDRDLTWFSRDRKRRGGRTVWCKPCMRAANRQRRVGISQDQFDAMLREQDGRCGICRTPFTTDHATPNATAVPRIDRSGDGTIRGLLCPRCKVGLSTFQDDVDRLRAAVEYLEL